MSKGRPKNTIIDPDIIPLWRKVFPDLVAYLGHPEQPEPEADPEKPDPYLNEDGTTMDY